jgi:hypothetical protein
MTCDLDGDTREAEIALMCKFLPQIENRRNLVDVDMYPAASLGYRFSKGNSSIVTDTRGGKPIQVILTYEDIDNPGKMLSPSRFNKSQINFLANSFVRSAPHWVQGDSSVDIETVIHPTSRPCVNAQVIVLHQAPR